MVREIVYALINSILFTLSFLLTLSILSNKFISEIINSTISEISILNFTVALTLGIFVSLIFSYFIVPKLQVKELNKLIEVIAEANKKLTNQIIVLEEIDRNLASRIKINEENNKRLEERIIALEKLVLTLIETKKKS
jgi:hypothetical protein